MSQAGSSGQPRVCLKACLIVVHTGPISLTTTPQRKQQGLSTKARGRNTPSQYVPQPLTDARTQLWPSLVGLAPHHTARHHHPTQTGSAPRPNTTPHWLETHLHHHTLASTTAHLLQTLIHHQAARFNTLGSKPILLEAVRCGGASVTTEAPPPDTATTTRKIPAIQLF